MKTANEIVSKLKEHQASSPSKWRENAEWRMANKSWLRYSQHIAMKMLDKMDELGMTQKRLSELMDAVSNMCPRFSKDKRIYLLKHWQKLSAVSRYLSWGT